MIDDAAETPSPSRRSIPPVADWETPPPPSLGSSWGWVLGTLWIAAMIPLGLHWYGSLGGHSAGAEGPAQAMTQAAVGDTNIVAVVPGIRGRVVVPEAAVTEIDGKATVFVAERSLHLLLATPVVLGPAKGANREILSGVAAGEMVVTNGVSTLRSMASR